jgi:hypothetical protein
MCHPPLLSTNVGVMITTMLIRSCAFEGRKVVAYALDRVREGEADPLIRKVVGEHNAASCGRNATRKLLHRFCREDADNLLVPIKDSLSTRIIYPHELFTMILRRYPDEFRRRFRADPVYLKYFWSALRFSDAGKELFDTHPLLTNKTEYELMFTIPLVWHSDAGPFTKKQGMQLVQWGCVHGVGADIEQRFLSLAWIAKYGDARDNKGRTFKHVLFVNVQI